MPDRPSDATASTSRSVGGVSVRADGTIRPTPMLIIGMVSGVFSAAFENIAVATAMPEAARDLDGLTYYAWAFTLFVIGQLVGTAVGGRVNDRIGPLRPMLIGFALFAVGLVVAGVAPVWPMLLVGRLTQGLGAGAMFVSLTVVIARLFDDADRARVMAWISAAWVVPAFVGPPIAGWLAERLSWHWVFFSVLPLLLLAAVLVIPIVVRVARAGLLDADADNATPIPLWAPGLAAAAAASLQAAGQSWAAGMASLAGLFAVVGVVLLVVALPKLMPEGFARMRRGLASVVWCRMIFPGAFFGAESFLPLMLVETRGLSLTLAGAILTVGSLGWALGAWGQSRPWVRGSRNRLVVFGVIAVAVGVGVASIASWLPAAWPGIVALGWVIAGLGMGLAVASTSLVVMTLSPTAQQGRNAASLQIAEGIGVSIFVGLSGTIFAALHPSGNLPLTFGTVASAMMVVAVLALPFALRIGRVSETVPLR
ncbi:MFS transporter [Naumannella huperziae]